MLNLKLQPSCVRTFSVETKPEDLAGALEQFQKSVKLLPTERAYVELGRSALKLDKLDAAAEALDKCIREFPNGPRRGEAETLLADVRKKLAKKK